MTTYRPEPESEGWYRPGAEFPDPRSSEEEREHCARAVASLCEAERHLLTGDWGRASYCCADACVHLGQFTHARLQSVLDELRGAALTELELDDPYWDVHTLRVVAKGLNAVVASREPYDPMWKDDYRGRPPFMGPVPIMPSSEGAPESEDET